MPNRRTDLRGSRGGPGGAGPGDPIPFRPPPPLPPPPPARPRLKSLKKLRIALILAGLGLLAAVSTVFGMMMAVSQDLPALENRTENEVGRNSLVFDARGRKLATLTGRHSRILVGSEDISPSMKQAIVAVEDRRFYEHHGVDFQGIARALAQDIRRQRAVQGGSTITQQFVKNALATQRERTIFQKLREASIAYHLERKWSKDKVLAQYLNTIYFGEGAYGIESAARTYFGWNHEGCGGPGNRCASLLAPHESALLAGLVASPARYSPRQSLTGALGRRNLVLKSMRKRGTLSESEYRRAVREALPAPADIEPPSDDSKAPYFTSWLVQQLVDRYGSGRAFGGGLKVYTTLDLDLQAAAEQAVSRNLGGIGPAAAAVVLDNRTGGVRAMVGGFDYRRQPFNLATNGRRQPGSSFKPFVLATALKSGIGPGSLWTSRKKVFPVPNSGGKEKFVVRNYEDQYSGVTTLAGATIASDNSVYAELGIKLGTRKVKRIAEQMGIETPVSTNPAMTLGGLKRGLTPLEMAHAYVTFARGGQRVTGTLASEPGGPVAITKALDDEDEPIADNRIELIRALPEGVARQATAILQQVISRGTGKRAAIGDFAAGKTGTTENYGDAWFVGYTEDVTIAVWVGYPNSNRPMLTEYGGHPVAGGTYPAAIWQGIATAARNLAARKKAEAEAARARREQEEALRKAARAAS